VNNNQKVNNTDIVAAILTNGIIQKAVPSSNVLANTEYLTDLSCKVFKDVKICIENGSYGMEKEK
jgi:hypothetical protein